MYSSELLLNGIVTQRLDFDRCFLNLDSIYTSYDINEKFLYFGVNIWEVHSNPHFLISGAAIILHHLIPIILL